MGGEGGEGQGFCRYLIQLCPFSFTSHVGGFGITNDDGITKLRQPSSQMQKYTVAVVCGGFAIVGTSSSHKALCKPQLVVSSSPTSVERVEEPVAGACLQLF